MILKPIHPNEPVTEDGKKPSRVLIEVIQRIIAKIDGLVLSGGGSVWGAITGTLSSQTDLQAALDAKAAFSHTHTSAAVTDFAEATRDTIGAALVAGSNVTITVNDPGDTITIAATAGPLSTALEGLAGSAPDWTPYWSTGDVINYFRTTAFTRGLLDDGNAGSAKTTIGLFSGVATVTVPQGWFEWEETVAAIGVVPGDFVMLALAPTTDSDENSAETLDLVAMAATPGTDQITINITFSEPTSGPVLVNWMTL